MKALAESFSHLHENVKHAQDLPASMMKITSASNSQFAIKSGYPLVHLLDYMYESCATLHSGEYIRGLAPLFSRRIPTIQLFTLYIYFSPSLHSNNIDESGSPIRDVHIVARSDDPMRGHYKKHRTLLGGDYVGSMHR